MKGKFDLDGLGLAGVIVNVVVTGIQSLGYSALLIVGLVVIWSDAMGILYILLSLLLGSLSIITLVFNVKVLAGETKYKKVASILGYTCFSILGSVLLMISKEEGYNKKKEENLAETLLKMKELLDNGAITEEEFTNLKNKIIGG